MTRTSAPICSATMMALDLVRLEVPKQGRVQATTLVEGRPIFFTAMAQTITHSVESTPPEMPTTQWSSPAYCIRLMRPETWMSSIRSQ